MREKTIADVGFYLPNKQPEDGTFDPVNTLVKDIKDAVEQQLIETNNQAIFHCAAYIAFEYGLLELLNNSSDADAAVVEIYILQNEHNEIKIVFRDKKSKEPITNMTTSNAIDYDWRRAVTTPSKKIHLGKSSCGQHLALATLAFFLENHDGALLTRHNRYGGFDVYLNSTMHRQKDNITPRAYTLNGLILNCVESMLASILIDKECGIFFADLEQPEYSDHMEKTKEQLEEAAPRAQQALSEITNQAGAVRNAIHDLGRMIEARAMRLNDNELNDNEEKGVQVTLEDPAEAIARFKERRAERAKKREEQTSYLMTGLFNPEKTASPRQTSPKILGCDF